MLSHHIHGRWTLPELIELAPTEAVCLRADLCAVAWTWLALACPGAADAATPRPPGRRARARIPLAAQTRTVPADAWSGALPADALVREMTCRNDL